MKRVHAWHLALAIALTFFLWGAGPASAEVFLDLYGGASFFGKPDFTVTTNNGASREKERGESDTEVTFGGRLGVWVVPWLGLAGDVSYFEPQFTAKGGSGNLVKVKIQTVPMSPLLMLRVPFLQSPEYPGGQFSIYAGVGPGFFWTQSTTQFLNGAAEKVSADTIEIGVDFRGGIAWQATPGVKLFSEYRFTHFALSPQGRFNGQRAKVEADLDAQHVLVGVGFSFR